MKIMLVASDCASEGPTIGLQFLDDIAILQEIALC
jgi:hypothetical protein